MSRGVETMLKAMAWQNAKGALRAAVEAMCSVQPLTVDQERDVTERWKKLDKLVEDLISTVEDEGLME